ncbi:MAG: glycerol-3-phosphate 1-O-acyltransferase PlsY [Candidatus Eremiobacteraeota bacterium]|nr:glycerol-3-phosphate 1-O-acyltransferase PlsY [Candidatus Eremiobacteraeota bacterium]MBC5827023.1 glycerol-3-phosphate 1-O-acyltransferase PlsY [Candidatus Eremiobacteraeota bacterium]
MTLTFPLMLLGAYIVGSIPFGIIVGRGLFGVDPRTVGSGNIGAANSLRALGKTGATLVLIGDVIKGVLPTALALHAFREPPTIVAAVGLATIVGHNWSVFLRFTGGKGVATGLGVLVVLSLWGGIAFGVVWFAVLALTRYSSLSSMLANAAVPLALLLTRAPTPYVLYAVVALGFVLWRHESNIKRLLAGKERRIGSPKEQNEPT